MQYLPPIQDITFDLEHLSQWSELRSLPCYGEFDLADFRAVLGEFGRFCSEVIAPLGPLGDETGSKLHETGVELPEGYKEAYAQFAEMGWQSLPHAQEHGGMGFPRAVGAAATEILNAADMSFGLCPLLTDGAIDALVKNGSEQQKALYLEKLVTGEWSGTMNLTEPQAGSDLARIRTRAERREDGSYAITGTKIFITYGEHALSGNIVHLVLARTPGAPSGPKGLSLFIVPKYLPDAEGGAGARNAATCLSLEHKLGVHASPTTVMEFEGATGFLVGEENRGLEYMFIMMTSARFAVGVQGVAIAERSYQHALAYARERVQSRPVDGSSVESVPIIQHPDVRRMLLRMRATVEGCRALAIATAGWLDLAEHGDGGARDEAAQMAEFLVPLVKGFSTERAVEVASLGVQVHGGMGFIEETGVARFYRDARILPIYEGTTAIQANDLLGRKVLRDRGSVARRFALSVSQIEHELAQVGPEAKAVADRLAAARSDFEAGLEYLLEVGRETPNLAYAGSVPFLMLTGNLAAGWQLGRSMLAATEMLARGEDADFMSRKIATASFYAHNILVETAVERMRILHGAPSLLSADV
ncbi:acyl-CoA dehydrogenase [Sedimentimonas flavescens]|uniref:acyl-CoA dehydrogenase n=1 Tax=Sedimentimonas flavescens TaxID=2851012 RepID=UPI001C49F572|nr:acyl-CoA dehydrogenase [Sedimentimonas flavescens]MBW0159435.1 acyl-CoA dehydrogenase [Sedimentimonas flavescens]